LKLECDVSLSNLAFNANLRRYDKDLKANHECDSRVHSQTLVGRCRLTL
jgi:hypothetical protein